MRLELYREIMPGAYPGLRLALLLIAGILCSKWWAIGGMYWLIAFAVTAGILLFYAWRDRNAQLQTCFYLITVFLFGGLWFTLHNQEAEVPELRLTLLDAELTIHGSILKSRPISTGIQAEIKVDSVEIAGPGVWEITFLTNARMRGEEGKQAIAAGNYIKFEGTVSEPLLPRNPHDFDYRGFLKKQNIHTITDIQRIVSVRNELSPFSWLYWRLQSRSLIEAIFSPPNAGLAKALLLGDRQGLSNDEAAAFSRVGLSHLMAVSGMHVGFMLLPFWFAIPYFWTFRFGKVVGLAVVILILIVYCGITGFSTSVMRASVMALLFIYGKLFQQPRETLNLLGIAAVVILIANPAELFEIGFQLSFTAVLVILLILPASRKMLPPNYREGKVYTLYQFVVISICVQAALYPILMYYFGEYSLIGPISNILAVGFVQVMFLLSLLCIPIEVAVPGLGAWLNTPSDWIISGLQYYANYAATLEWSWVSGTISSPFLFMLWTFLFLMIASIFKPVLRWKMLVMFLLSACLFQLHQLYQDASAGLTVTVFDVGQGDAVLLQTPEGKNILYDTGVQSFYHNSAERVILPELKSRGIRQLDAVILSHPHADHIGGISMLISHIPIKAIYDSGLEHGSNVYRNYREDARRADIPVESVGWGDIIEIGSSMRFFVTGPHPDLPHNPNTRSVVVRAVYGNTSILLAGDADLRSEKIMAAQYGDFLRSDLLKVGHHASHTSSGEEFLSAVQPAYAAASLARRNRYNHPHPDATLRLSQSGAQALFTSLDGALVFTSDGKTLRHVDWRK